MRWCLAAALAVVAAGCLDSPPDGDDSEEPCGTIRSLRDDFDERSGQWEGAADVADGRLLLYAPPGGGSYIISAWHYLTEGGEVTLALRGVDLQVDGELRLLLVDVNDDSIGLDLAADSLSVQVDVDDNLTSPVSMTWQPDQLWWRIREEDGAIHWGVSTDGDAFTEGEPIENPLSGPVKVLVDLSAVDGQAAVDIEAINPASTEGACPLTSLQDDFSVELPRWTPTDSPGCQAMASSDMLSIAYDGEDVCGLISLERFDVRGGSAAIEVADLGDCDPSFSLEITFADRSAEIRCLDDGGPTLTAGLYGSTSETVASVDFDPSLHHFWRISNPPGTSDLVLATADAAGTWATLGTRTVDAEDLAIVGVNLLVIDGTVGDGLQSVVVDNFNLAPP